MADMNQRLVGEPFNLLLTKFITKKSKHQALVTLPCSLQLLHVKEQKKEAKIQRILFKQLQAQQPQLSTNTAAVNI